MLNPFQGTTGPGYVCTTTCSGAASALWAPAKVGLSWQTFSPQNGEPLLSHHSGEILISLEMGKALVHKVIQREGNSYIRLRPQMVVKQVLGELCASHLRAYSLPNPTDDHLQWAQDSLSPGTTSTLVLWAP